MTYNVFISSSQSDSGIAQDLAHRLRAVGTYVRVHEGPAPEDPAGAFSSRLKKADELFVILSDRSLKSPSLLFEMGAAWSQRKKVTPVVVGLEERELPPVIRQMPYVNYSNLSWYLSDLKKRLDSAG